MICSERIRLRGFKQEDLPLFVNWLNDPEVRTGLIHYLPFSLADEEQWFLNMQKSPVEEHPMVIEIRKSEEWLPIGDCGFYKIDWRCRAAEVGILIGEKSFWNRGIGTDVMRLLLQHGFNTLNLNRISLEVFENNPGAIRCYEKAGFIREGKRRQAMYKDGSYIDVLLMSVLKNEWQES